MPLEKLNAALIGAIQNSTPEYTNAPASPKVKGTSPRSRR
jgi:hypothetical protein